MTYLTTRLAFRALLTIVMQTEVHAEQIPMAEWGTNLTVCRTELCGREELRAPKSVNTIMLCTQTGMVVTCQYNDPSTCAPGHEQACQQRDNGASPYQGRGR